MPRWYNRSTGQASPFPVEAPPSSSITAFDRKKNAVFEQLEVPEVVGGGVVTRSAAVSGSRSEFEVSVKNEDELLKSLSGTELTRSILGHQNAANAVHARELAALQLKYATKKDELVAAHETHERLLRRDAAALRVEEFEEPVRSMSDLRVQYNALVQKVATWRKTHELRLREVVEAQETEAEGLRRERDALVTSLGEVEATFEASVKTLETQLLLLLRSKLEVEFRGRVDKQRIEIDQLTLRRDEQHDALAKLRAEYGALVRQLEDQQTQHAAHVAAAAREALARQRADAEGALARLAADQEEERAALEADLGELRAQAEKLELDHAQFLEQMRRAHEAEMDEARRKQDAALATEKSRRGAESADQIAALRRSQEAELAELQRQLDAIDARCAAAAEAIDRARADLDGVLNRAPRARAELEARHRADMAQLADDRDAAARARKAREQGDLDAAVEAAVADEKARAAAELERDRREDPQLLALRAEIDQLKADILAAGNRKDAALAQKEDELKALADSHEAEMVALVREAEDADSRLRASAPDDRDAISEAQAMARDFTRELLDADKAATADQLRADCAAYADALAALQRALAAERNAHGAQVRRLQAELDANESELALLRSEGAHDDKTEISEAFSSATTIVGATPRAVELSIAGYHLLDADHVDGDDPVAAEWRRLVAQEKSRLLGSPGSDNLASAERRREFSSSSSPKLKEFWSGDASPITASPKSPPPEPKKKTNKPTTTTKMQQRRGEHKTPESDAARANHDMLRRIKALTDQVATIDKQLAQPGLDNGLRKKLCKRKADVEADLGEFYG